jgi:hypothetical protein
LFLRDNFVREFEFLFVGLYFLVAGAAPKVGANGLEQTLFEFFEVVVVAGLNNILHLLDFYLGIVVGQSPFGYVLHAGRAQIVSQLLAGDLLLEILQFEGLRIELMHLVELENLLKKSLGVKV